MDITGTVVLLRNEMSGTRTRPSSKTQAIMSQATAEPTDYWWQRDQATGLSSITCAAWDVNFPDSVGLCDGNGLFQLRLSPLFVLASVLNSSPPACHVTFDL